ncbi:MAG: hypothetical protein AAGN82_01225 [Myxococcota bacterium]
MDDERTRQIGVTQPMTAVVPSPAAAAPPPAARHRRSPAQHALTAVANEAFTLVRAFEVAFAQPFPGWRAELREPMGPSTGGGKQALQAISIVDQMGHRLAVGSIDSAKRTATLRSYALVAARHEARFDGDPFLVREPDYQRFLDGVSNLMSSMSFSVRVETMAPTPNVASMAPPASNATLLWLAVLITALALAVGIYFAR